jgi:hypothetical protein
MESYDLVIVGAGRRALDVAGKGAAVFGIN